MPEPLTWSTTAPLPLGAEPTAAAAEPEAHDALRAGTRLDEFEIVRVLGAGGFGIVYLALDHVLLRYVAVKEYMPTALAGRGLGAMVSVRSAALAGTFAAGLESFFNEARMLASFDHPSLVKVYRFWKANGTAYMVMPYYAGHTLKEARRGMSAAPDEAWLRALVEPLLGALELLHGEGVYHRDIAPDNILLLPDGRPVLLDFGSARRVIGDRTQSLTAILKPNFAPVEQYADEPGMRQGPWTDLYALGATVHYLLTGQAPPPAVMRAVRDALPVLGVGSSAASAFMTTIDWTLALAPDDRPQDVASVRQGLSGERVPPRPTSRHGATPDLALAHVEVTRASAAKTTGPVTAPPPRRGRRAAFAGLALVGFGVAGGSLWALSPETATPPTLVQSTLLVEPAVTPAPSPVLVPPAAAVTVMPVAPEAVAPAPHRPTLVARVASDKPAAPNRAPRQAPDAAPVGTRPESAARGSPKESCGDLNFFSLALCVQRECAKPRWQAHAQCVEVRRTEESRQRRMEQ
ncbi:MAG: protein kinase [Burkholderiaceae bacterium]